MNERPIEYDLVTDIYGNCTDPVTEAELHQLCIQTGWSDDIVCDILPEGRHYLTNSRGICAVETEDSFRRS